MPKCSTCQEEKAAEAFSKSAYTPHGLRYNCKACEKANQRIYRQRYRDAHISPTAGLLVTLPAAPPPPAAQQDLAKGDSPLVMVLGDFHAPFDDRQAVLRVFDLVREYQPDFVVQVGDLYDMFAFSRYPRSHNVMTPDVELSEGHQHTTVLWHEIRKAAPAAQCYQLTGNHDDRPLKRILEYLPAGEQFVARGLRDLFTFDGVKTIHDGRDELVIAGVHYQHGHLQFGEHAKWNQASTVTGHLHKAAVKYFQNEHGIYWELNAGWLADANAPVFSYHARKRLHGCTLGVGMVDALGPRFIPFNG